MLLDIVAKSLYSDKEVKNIDFKVSKFLFTEFFINSLIADFVC